MRPLLACLAALALTAAAASAQLEVGAAAPAVTATTHLSEELALADLYARGPVLVFFYPRAGTPGCTTQACALAESFDELQQQGLQVVGVSCDGVEAQAAFAQNHQLPFPLLADPEGRVAAAFEVLVARNDRGTFAPRQSFLIRGGKVVWRDLRVSPATHLDQVRAALQATQP